MDALSGIYWSMEESERARIKFCIDTCHIWATGYDISTEKKVKKFYKTFDKLIGIDRIACIHLNDSKTGLESCVDRHTDLGLGFIGETGLKAFVIEAHKHNIPLIMETPLEHINPETNKHITTTEELKKVRGWIGD